MGRAKISYRGLDMTLYQQNYTRITKPQATAAGDRATGAAGAGDAALRTDTRAGHHPPPYPTLPCLPTSHTSSLHSHPLHTRPHPWDKSCTT